MQSIVACLKYGMLPETLPESLAQDLVPDVHAKRFYKRYGNFMTFKSHALPNKSYRRVIYLVRDGRDAMASYYGMYQNMGIQANLDAMIRQGKHLFPCKWHAHITAWEANPYGAEMEYIRYEDLLLNPLPELHKICQVLGVNYDKDFLLNVVEGNSFDAMKQRAKVLGTAHKYYDKHAEGHTFFRKGKMGSYKEDIPEHLIRFFEEEASEQLFRYKYL